jgi:hypothetical protein
VLNADAYAHVQVELVDDCEDLPVSLDFDKQVMSLIEKCGYPPAYIQQSLSCAELNHVTAFYSLLT